jgi:hypothetical protein
MASGNGLDKSQLKKNRALLTVITTEKMPGKQSALREDANRQSHSGLP